MPAVYNTRSYYTIPCLSFAYKTIVWSLYYTTPCNVYIQDHTIPCHANLLHTKPHHTMQCLPFAYKTIVGLPYLEVPFVHVQNHTMPNHGMPVFRIEDYTMSHHSIPCHTMPWVEIPDTMQCLSFVYHLSCTVGSFSLNISDKNEIGKVVILKKTPVFIKVDENSGIFRWSSDLYWEM